VPQELHGLHGLRADVVIGTASDPQHDPNIPFNPSIFPRQRIGKGKGGSSKSGPLSRQFIGCGAVQDSQGKAELGYVHVVIDGDRRAETGAGPAGAERQCEKGANPSALPTICRQGDSRMKGLLHRSNPSLWFAQHK